MLPILLKLEFRNPRISLTEQSRETFLLMGRPPKASGTGLTSVSSLEGAVGQAAVHPQ